MDAETANVWIAGAALATAAVSVFFTWKGLINQEKHNALSVIPVPFIALADYEDLIRVKVRNDGIGPLLVEGIDFELYGKKNEYEELVQYLPQPPEEMNWSNFSSGFVRSIRPGDELILIEIEIAEELNGAIAFRDQLRLILSKMTVTVRYSDVYGNAFTPDKRSLDFFARRLAPSKSQKKKNV